MEQIQAEASAMTIGMGDPSASRSKFLISIQE